MLKLINDDTVLACLDKSMEEAQAKQQLLEGGGLLAVVEEGWVTDRVVQVALQ